MTSLQFAELAVKNEIIIFITQHWVAMSKLEKIQNEILSLSTEERELVGIFLKSAQQAIDPEYNQAWQAELEKRRNEVQSVEVTLVSTKSVIADLRKKIFI
jgi:phage gp16-like protein